MPRCRMPCLSALALALRKWGQSPHWRRTGNPRPRMFRLTSRPCGDQPVGLQQQGPPGGAEAGLRRGRDQVLSASTLGPIRTAPTRLLITNSASRTFAELASYMTVNVSSPNTPGLRGLARPWRFGRTARQGLGEARKDGACPASCFCSKIAPDLDDEALQDIADVVLRRRH